MRVPEGATSRFVEIDGFRIHYFEAGHAGAPHLVLLHSCDYGSSAEFSWEQNIPALSRHFHILAPDMLGYGLSDKFYDFGGGHMPYRLRNLRRFLQVLCIDEADFIGNSCGASLLLVTAASAGPAYRQALPIRRMVLVSPSAIGTPGPGRAVFDAYDGTREKMRDLVRTMFFSERWASDEDYIDRRHEIRHASRTLGMRGRGQAPHAGTAACRAAQSRLGAMRRPGALHHRRPRQRRLRRKTAAWTMCAGLPARPSASCPIPGTARRSSIRACSTIWCSSFLTRDANSCCRICRQLPTLWTLS